MELSNLLDKELEIIVINMLTKLRRRMERHRTTRRDRKYKKEPIRANSRIEDAEEWISYLEDRVVEIT